MKDIGLKVGAKYGFGEMNALITRAVDWGFKLFELSATDVKDLDFYHQLQKQGINFGIHAPHAFLKENQMSLAATVEPYASKSVKWFYKTINLAKKIKAEYIIFHPDLYKIPKGNDAFPSGVKFAPDRQTGFKQMVNNVKTYSGQIPLLAETMPQFKQEPVYYNASLKDSLALKKALPKIKFCFDIDHSYEAMLDINKVIDWYQAIEKDILTLHVCDFDPKIRSHLVIGDGVIDFKEFFSSVKVGKDQRLVLEVLPYNLLSTKKDLLTSVERLKKLL